MPVNITEDFVRWLMQDKQELRQLNIRQDNQILELTDKVIIMTAKIEELTQTIKELEEKLNKNSKNSSKPPSSDGLKKQNLNTSLRKKSNKKQGAQLGHDGTRMIITGEPDHVTDLIPAPCQKCPQWQKCKGFRLFLFRDISGSVICISWLMCPGMLMLCFLRSGSLFGTTFIKSTLISCELSRLVFFILCH